MTNQWVYHSLSFKMGRSGPILGGYAEWKVVKRFLGCSIYIYTSFSNDCTLVSCLITWVSATALADEFLTRPLL